MAAKKKTETIEVRQVKSLIGSTDKQRQVVKGLGLRRIGHVVERPDDPGTRGMVAKVAHLVEVIGE